MFKSRRGDLLAAVCSAGLICGFAAGPAAAETLADAIALAYDSNPTLQAQRATLRALDETYVQARSGYRPSASATVQEVYSDSRAPGVGISQSQQGNASLSVSQPLFTGGRVGAAVSAAEADILTGRETLRRIEAQVLGNVIIAYVGARRDQEALRIRKENVLVLERQLEESKARFDVGEITRTDVAQAESRLASAVSQFQSAEAQLAITRANYVALVGQTPGDLAPEPSLANLLPATIDQAFDVAQADNAQIRAAQYVEQASKARLAGARAERMPSVALRTTLGFSGDINPIDTDLYSRNLTTSVGVTVPLFTGGLTNSRVRQSVERNNVDRIGVETARRAVLQGLTQSWSQLSAARANIGSTDTQVRAARIAAEGTRQEQQVGLRTTLDVLNAEQELRAAELAQISARFDEYVAATNVLAQMGRLEAASLTPNVPRYDPKTNFGKLRFAWGWTPWEEPIAIVDSLLTPQPSEMPRGAAATPPK